ncbi:MAG: cell division protein FtsL [Candidatus Riflebacteria bacterium]|nr:cell division protein FtsL [Candidatus Riflebacteria bacterium]
MSDTNNLPKRRRVRFSTEIMFILSAIFCVALSLIYLSRYNDIRNLLQTEAEQRERIEDLERENRMLKENLDMLSTPEGIERLARERLGLVKPEEVVVYTIDDKNEPITASEAVVITKPVDSNALNTNH